MLVAPYAATPFSFPLKAHEKPMQAFLFGKVTPSSHQDNCGIFNLKMAHAHSGGLLPACFL